MEGVKGPDGFAELSRILRDAEPIDASGPPPGDPWVPFGELWGRLARGVVEGMGEAGSGPRADLVAGLAGRLAALGEPTLWEELNARRSPQQVVAESLRPGGPRRTLYCGMLEELRADGLASFTARYPVLRRHLVRTVESWREASRELLERVEADRELLADAFGVPAGARLAGIEQDLSDPHRGGRTVALLDFADGPERHRVVYKPKDLSLDDAFQRLVARVPPPTGADAPLRGVGLLARDGYGYMEWVPHRVCDDDRELRRFYRNAGRLTAILYLLGGSDCHHENFVADGDQLHLVDGETLLQGVPRVRNPDRSSSAARSSLYDRMGDSVLRLGLLPQWNFVGERRAAHDLSALGVAPPRRAWREEVGWVEPGTDAMIAGRVRRATEAPTSSPVGVGGVNRLGDFADDYCGGLEDQLLAIAAEKRRWLGELGELRNHRSRFVRRATWIYVETLAQQAEPEALVAEEAQRRAQEERIRDWAPFLAEPTDPQLVAAEVAQLDRLDVPFFEQQVDGRDLLVPGGAPVPGFFETSGRESARRRIARLDAGAIELELALARGVIATKGMHAHRPARPASSGGAGELPEPSAAERREEAAAIGDHLVGTAIGDEEGAMEWLGIDVALDAVRSSYRPLGLSLYSGRTGIALFLAALARAGAGRSDDYVRVALGACSDFERIEAIGESESDGRGWWRGRPLGLAGGGGILLALLELRELLPAIATPVEAAISFLLGALEPDALASERQLDLIFGSAGLIGPLLAVGTREALALAEAAGEALVRGQDDSGGWITPASGELALTGLSHGAAGICAALARLHGATGSEAYLAAAGAGLEWERSQFDQEARNWPDFRGGRRAAPQFMLSWCHGAPGIALSRLCLEGTPLWGAEVESDLERALESTAELWEDEDSLCCGQFGRAAILRIGAAHRGRRDWLEAASQLEAIGLAGRRASGSYSFKDVPGLFQGFAGVGMALLDDDLALTARVLTAGLRPVDSEAVRS